ncbi:MAG TPA: nuclear transport factor 2 family protein [Holophagaceae bacterium]|nr:nuclear transport factor 2 family protein [Holophagaceae bacterium]
MRSLILAALVSAPMLASPGLKAKAEALNKAFAAAMVKGDAAAVAGLYTEDARLLFFKGQTLKGRAAIHETLAGMFKGMKVTAMSIVSEECHPLGEALLDMGHYEMTSEAEGKTTTEKARYVQVLKKGKDGQWRLFMDCPLPD